MASSSIFTFNSENSFKEVMKSNSDESSIWTSETIKTAYDKIELGIEPKPSPFFFKRDNKWRKGNLVYEYTKEELLELEKCINSVKYFADNYVFLLSPEGYVKIVPRGYQHKMLLNYEKERNVVVLSARQVGKCLTFDTMIKIKEGSKEKEISIGELYYQNLKKKRKLSFLEKIKYYLYRKIYNKDNS